MSFTVIMPIKPWDGAKSRLHVDPAVRRDLARAFALDALEAVTQCPEVADVVVVTGGTEVAEDAVRAGAHVIEESTDSGTDPLGAAVLQGVAWAQSNHPDRPLAVVPADLPALTSDDLGSLLRDSSGLPLAFVADANGDGTTVLIASSPSDLRAGYGPSSAERHRSYGAVELTAPGGMRRDVDEFRELLEAHTFGLGTNTAAAFARLGARTSA